MKTKELIKLLQESDPTGELLVTIGKCPIKLVDYLPWYYDGRAKDYIKDESGKIIGMDLACSSNSHHIDITCQSTREFILDYIMDESSSPLILNARESMKDTIQGWINDANNLKKRCDNQTAASALEMLKEIVKFNKDTDDFTINLDDIASIKYPYFVNYILDKFGKK